MGSLRTDTIQLEIVIQNDQARKSIRLLSENLKDAKKEQSKFIKDSDEWKDKQKEIDRLDAQIKNLKNTIGITGMTLKELRDKQRELNMEFNHMDPNHPKYVILKKDIDEVAARIKELRGGAKQVDGMFGKLFGAVTLGDMAANAIQNVASGFKDFVKDGIKSAIEFADAQKILQHALDGNKEKTQELVDLANEKAKTTLFSRKEIMEAETFLAIQGRSQEQIRKTISAATQLSTVTGVDLNTAVKDLDGTMELRLGKSLGKLESELRGLTKTQLKNGEAIDLIRAKYSGLAEAEMQTTEGKINQLGKAWAGLKRAVGEVFTNGGGGYFDGFIGGLTGILTAVKENMGVFVSLVKVVAVMASGYIAYRTVLGTVNAYETISTNLKAAQTAVVGLFTRAKIAETVVVEESAIAQKAAATAAAGATVALGAETAVTETATVATTALNTATKASPWGLLIGIITAVASALWMFASTSRKVQNISNDISNEAQKNIVDEKNRVKELYEIAKDKGRTDAERNEALRELNEISPKYLGYLNLETIGTKEAKEMIDKYNDSLLLQQKIKVATDKLNEISKKRIDLETGKDDEAKLGFWDKFIVAMKHYGASQKDMDAAMSTKGIDKVREALEKLKKEEEDVIKDRNAAIEEQKNSGKKNVENQKKVTDMTIAELQREKDALMKMNDPNADERNRLREITRVLEHKEKEAEVEKKKNEKILHDYNDLHRKLKELDEQHIGDKLTETQKEIFDAQQKYETLIKGYKKYLSDNKKLTPQRIEEVKLDISNLEDKKDQATKNILTRRMEEFKDAILAIHEKMRVAKLSITDKEIYDINQKYDKMIEDQTKAIQTGHDDRLVSLQKDFDEGLISEEEYTRRCIGIEDSRAHYLVLLDEKTGDLRILQQGEIDKAKLDGEVRFENELEALKDKSFDADKDRDEKELQRIDRKYDKLREMYQDSAEKLLEIEQAAYDEAQAYQQDADMKKLQQVATFAAQEAQKLSDTLFTIANTKRQAATDAQLSDLDKQKQKELDNKNLTEDQKKTIEEKYHKKEVTIRTKAWKDNQDAAATQAEINGLLAVTNILATMPWNTFGLAQVLAIAAVATTTVEQVAAIRSAQMPEFAKGGYTAPGPVDQPAGVVHAGEYVVSQKLLQDEHVRKMVEIIEQKRTGKSMDTGGYQDGGYVIPAQMRNETVTETIIKVIDKISSVSDKDQENRYQVVMEEFARETQQNLKVITEIRNIEQQRDAEINQVNDIYHQDIEVEKEKLQKITELEKFRESEITRINTEADLKKEEIIKRSTAADQREEEKLHLEDQHITKEEQLHKVEQERKINIMLVEKESSLKVLEVEDRYREVLNDSSVTEERRAQFERAKFKEITDLESEQFRQVEKINTQASQEISRVMEQFHLTSEKITEANSSELKRQEVVSKLDELRQVEQERLKKVSEVENESSSLRLQVDERYREVMRESITNEKRKEAEQEKFNSISDIAYQEYKKVHTINNEASLQVARIEEKYAAVSERLTLSSDQQSKHTEVINKLEEKRLQDVKKIEEKYSSLFEKKKLTDEERQKLDIQKATETTRVNQKYDTVTSHLVSSQEVSLKKAEELLKIEDRRQKMTEKVDLKYQSWLSNTMLSEEARQNIEVRRSVEMERIAEKTLASISKVDEKYRLQEVESSKFKVQSSKEDVVTGQDLSKISSKTDESSSKISHISEMSSVEKENHLKKIEAERVSKISEVENLTSREIASLSTVSKTISDLEHRQVSDVLQLEDLKRKEIERFVSTTHMQTGLDMFSTRSETPSITGAQTRFQPHALPTPTLPTFRMPDMTRVPSFNFPEIQQSIRNTRVEEMVLSRVQQLVVEQKKISQQPETTATNQVDIRQLAEEIAGMKAVMSKLNENIDGGITANLVYRDFKRIYDQYQALEQETKIQA